MIPEPRRYFFVHIQKTGGTDLFIRLGGTPATPRGHKFAFDACEIYPDDSDGDIFTVAPNLVVDRLLERWQARRQQIRVIIGHFPLCTVELLDAQFTTLTVLREPVERTLSFLRHHRKTTPADRDKSLEEIYEDDFRFHSLIHNHMTKMLGLTTDEMTDGMLTRVSYTDAHLERAKQQLRCLDVVGVQERFNEFCSRLEAKFGWDLGQPLFANRTVPVDVPASFRRKIAADNAMDVELYGLANELIP